MDLHATVLVLHIGSGAAGLALAGPVLRAPKQRGGTHARLGRAYVASLAVMCATALILVAGDPRRLAHLGVIAVVTLAWGTGGLLVARRRPRLPGGWRVWHLNLMGSSVIAFVTAFAVTVLGGGAVAWILPTLVGSPLIAGAMRRHARRPPGDPGGPSASRRTQGAGRGLH